MNRNDDIERVLEQWFTEGPRHMSDRLFDGTLERIERLPRGRLVDLQSRLPAMNLNLRLVAATAALIVVAAASLAVINTMPGVGAPVSPSPSATRYVAPYFRPFADGTGTFSATIRSEGSAQTPSELQLATAWGYIFIVSRIQPGTEVASETCAPRFSGPQTTPAALAAWIQTFASLEVSPPRSVTVGGLSGLVLDVAGRPGASGTCGMPTTHRIEVLGGGSWFYPDSKVRLILLDRGDGASILIDIGSRGEATWASIEARMPIVDGFEFKR